ncbi:MAG TPA: hypothetical protein VIW21_10330, partial [Chthoniobacterales bacterium]
SSAELCRLAHFGSIARVFLQLFHGLLCGLTCIESLVNYPGTLELRQFTMRGNKLKAERLVEAEPLAPVR